MSRGEKIAALKAAYDIIEGVYEQGEEDTMYMLLGCTGSSVQESLLSLSDAIKEGVL